MSNGDRIRQFSDKELVQLLWWHSVKQLAAFVAGDTSKMMNCIDLKKFIESEDYTLLDELLNERD